MYRLRWAVAILVLTAGHVFSERSAAQNQLGSLDEINQQFGPQRFTFAQKVLTGQDTATPAQLDAASKYYIYRLTDVNAQMNDQLMLKYVKEFEAMIAIAAKADNASKNRKMVGEFAPHLVNRFKEVFTMDFGPNRIAIVNAATLLPHAAKLRHDVIGDFLAAVVADEKTHDLVRIYAATGLGEYFPVRPLTKFEKADKTNLDRKERDRQRIDALIKFMDRPMPTTTVQEEFDGFRYVRGKAVAALARTGVPAVTAMSGKPEGPVAVALLKILAKKVQPEPSIRERLEAAIGVCYFNKFVEEYDPKIGVYLVGACVSDVFSEYKKDYANIALKTKAKPTYLPWKHESKRLEAALAELASNTSKTPSAEAAKRIESIARPNLQAMYDSQQLNRDVEFRTEVQKMRPASKVLFKNAKGTMLEFDWDTAAPAEDK